MSGWQRAHCRRAALSRRGQEQVAQCWHVSRLIVPCHHNPRDDLWTAAVRVDTTALHSSLAPYTRLPITFPAPRERVSLDPAPPPVYLHTAHWTQCRAEWFCTTLLIDAGDAALCFVHPAPHLGTLASLASGTSMVYSTLLCNDGCVHGMCARTPPVTLPPSTCARRRCS